MLSRVADSIYWMGRYVERAENIARCMDVHYNLALDLGPEMGNHWGPLISTTGDHEAFYARYDQASQRNVIWFLTFADENPNSVLSCLRAARENARTVRDMISSQMWEELNKFYLMVREARTDESILFSPFEFFGKVKLGGSLLEGVAESTMSRGEAWHFRRLGVSIERADKTSRILDVKYYLLLPSVSDVGTPIDTNQWVALLKSVSALEMYRKEHGRTTPTQVAEFLILDRHFPRSIHFCVIRAEESLLSITGSKPGTYRTVAEQRLGRLRSELDYGNIHEIIAGGVHEFIDGFQEKLNLVGEAICEAFFAVPPPHELTRPTEGSQSQSQKISGVAAV
jgi:uncharacterized alpha-E superfamily protein